LGQLKCSYEHGKMDQVGVTFGNSMDQADGTPEGAGSGWMGPNFSINHTLGKHAYCVSKVVVV
jgi:hypothetical protein